MHALLVWIASMAMVLAGPSTGPAYWRAVLHNLDDVRAIAFTTADVDLLAGVYGRGTPLRGDDADTIADYVRRGLEIDGMQMRVRSLRVLDHSRSRARLEVVDQLGPTRVRHDNGRWQSLPADRPTARIVTLAMSPEGWRIISVQSR